MKNGLYLSSSSTASGSSAASASIWSSAAMNASPPSPSIAAQSGSLLAGTAKSSTSIRSSYSAASTVSGLTSSLTGGEQAFAAELLVPGFDLTHCTANSQHKRER